jgi:soluble lytic murein transglycosylase-like protein
MFRGPALVIQGSFFGSVLLVIFLLVATAGASYPAPPAQLNEESQQDPGILDETHPTEDEGAPIEQATNIYGSCSISEQYPESILQWCVLITHYAVKRGLNPDLVAALIWQESGGNPVAYSQSGAVGLMQVMPSDGIAATFMCINGPCFNNRPTIGKLQDPEFNISYGTKMLAGLLSKNGNMRDALKSYGPMNVGYYYADKVLGIFERYGHH